MKIILKEDNEESSKKDDESKPWVETKVKEGYVKQNLKSTGYYMKDHVKKSKNYFSK